MLDNVDLKTYNSCIINNRKEGMPMSENEKRNFSETVKILMQLDKQSLLLIDSGARLLAARQDMTQNQPAEPVQQ